MGVGVFLQADLLTVSYSTSRNTGDRKSACRNGGISASRLTDYQLLCQQNWRL